MTALPASLQPLPADLAGRLVAIADTARRDVERVVRAFTDDNADALSSPALRAVMETAFAAQLGGAVAAIADQLGPDAAARMLRQISADCGLRGRV